MTAVRKTDRGQDPSRSPGSCRQMAPGRGRDFNSRPQTLALAIGRCKRRRTGDPEAKPQKCPCRQAVLDEVDEAMGWATRPRDGQTAQLWRGSPRSLPKRRSSFPQGVEQPIRGVASTHTTKRKDHGSFQIPTPSAAFSIRSRSGRDHLPSKTPPPFRSTLPPISG